MDFPKDFELQGPWVPVTPKKPISTKRSAASSSDWLGSGDVLAGMNGGPDSSWGPSNWRQEVADSPSQQMPRCSSNVGEMQTQSFDNPMQMSYRTLLALSDPAITSNMTNLAPLLLAQMGGHGSGGQMMPPASPNQNQLAHIFACESSSQMMPPASPNQNQLTQLVARERSSQMMPHASPNQNQLAQLVARERSSQMMPHASPNQNQLAQLVTRESSSQMMPPASPNPNQLAQLAQLIARQRSRQMMPPASPNQNQLAACERSSQMMPPASSRQNQFFLNGNSLPASSNSSSNNWQPQTMTPKAQYGLPVPLLPNLNSLPETHMMNTVVSKSVASPETPANLGKNMRSQDFRAVEIIDLVDDTATSQNNHHNRFCQQTAVQEALLSVAGPGMSSNIVALQQQEGEMNVPPSAEISLQQAEGENPGIDLNKTPEPKPKRKKHRPKVIREGKAAKTPKPVTPKPVTPRRAKKTENPPQAKRKYVWKKKKDLSSVENPSEALGESTNPQNGSGSKPVRRSLNFDTEDCQARDDGARPERFTHDAGPQAVISSSNTKSDVQSVGIGTLENPLGVGNSFDLNSSTNPLRNEYVSVPQTPNPPSQPSRQEMMLANQTQAEYIRMLNSITSPPQTARREGENMKKLARMNSHLNTAGNCVISSQPGQNQSASDKNYDALLKGTKRNHSLVDDAQISGHPSHMHAYNGMNRGSENCGTSRNGLCSPEIYKRLRTENMQNEGTSTAYSTFTCNPGSPQTVQADQNTSKAFTFADAQRFMVYEKLRAFQRMLARKQADNTANNRPSQAPSRPLKAVVDYQRAATPVKPSGHNNAGSYQPSTPEKPPEFTSSHDITSIGPQARIEAYIASSELKQKARGRKKKEQVPVNLMSSKSKRSENEAASSTTEFPRGQESLSTSSPTKNTNINNSHIQITFVQDSQGTSKPKGPVSQNSQLGTVVPYMGRIDELVRRLSCLNINDGNKKVSVQEQNALIPYVGGDGAMVVFEGKKRKPRPKVDLDPESDRVWRLLMGREVEGDAEMGVDKEKWWEEERRVFRGRAESFIARMHLVQGDRRFSKWKGSVVDSVVGVFLTQNVSDHLSSSAFMSLVSKFPARSSGTNNTTNLENISRPVASNDTLSGEGRMSEQQSCDPSSVVIHEVASSDEREMMSSNESPESNTGSSNSDYLGINNVNSHELELGIGRESPDSGSATAVTVTSSTSGIEGEDRSSMEDVVSSQNSVASQNFSKYHVQTADQGKVNSLLNFESDLLSGGMGNGFNSFTELLNMANSRGLQELNGPGNGRTLSTEHSPGINQFRKVGIDEMPSLPNPPSYLCGAGPSICTSNSHLQFIQSDFRSSSYAPSLSSYYQNCLSSNIMGLENTGTVEGKLSNASSAASGINKTNGTEVMGKQCSPSAENSTKGMDQHPLLASRVASIDTYAPIKESPMQPGTSLGSEIRVEMHSSCQRNVVKETIQASDRTCSGKLSLSSEDIAVFQQREREAIWQVESTQHGVKAEGQKGNQLTPQTCSIEQTNNDKNQENLLEGVGAVKPNSRKEASSSQKVSEASKNASKGKKVKPETDKKKSFDWDSLRKQACCDGAKKERSSDTMDSLDYEALRNADVNVISHTIRERGMNNMLAERIKEFLNRLVRDHGSTDLEWLRYVPPDKAKDYLLSIRGLGLKSVECVRLLTLHHLAFPVDTNVGRICVRLGWVPLQPLPESLQLHLLEMYPILETIQKYLWPRLCKLDQRTLYELHYQLITFGKVFCTKSKPNCNACPMRGECKHFASAFASARLALPGPEEKGLVSSRSTSFPEGIHVPVLKTVPLPQLEGSTQAQDQTVPRICEPIIEEPASPGPECVETLESAIEDDFFDDPDEIPTINLNMEEFTQNLQSYMQQNNMDLQDGDMSKALVAITPDSANIPMPKLKNVSRLRTEHQVYELPDSHPLLEGLDKRERDDPSPYLLAIWTPGETAQSTEGPKVYCDSQDTGNLCMAHDCFTCNSVREAKAQLVRGTILIPCRTAMRGSFPLNGTYFQVNEVFADHDSSRVPIDVPRNWIWNLPRRTVYFGTSVTTIFKGLTTEGIQQCFWRGFVCVRGFDRKSCSPKPLYARLHFPASKTTKEKRTAAEAEAAAAAAKAKE